MRNFRPVAFCCAAPRKLLMTQPAPNQNFLRIPQVCQQTGMSRAAIYAAMKRGDFPKNFRIGPRAVAWTLASVQTWQEACIKASQA